MLQRSLELTITVAQPTARVLIQVANPFLDGHAVHTGAELELLLANGHWVPLRYEWSWRDDEAPNAHLALGAPPEAQRQGVQPTVAFELPARAILRWPTRRSRR